MFCMLQPWTKLGISALVYRLWPLRQCRPSSLVKANYPQTTSAPLYCTFHCNKFLNLLLLSLAEYSSTDICNSTKRFLAKVLALCQFSTFVRCAQKYEVVSKVHCLVSLLFTKKASFAVLVSPDKFILIKYNYLWRLLPQFTAAALSNFQKPFSFSTPDNGEVSFEDCCLMGEWSAITCFSGPIIPLLRLKSRLLNSIAFWNAYYSYGSSS